MGPRNDRAMPLGKCGIWAQVERLAVNGNTGLSSPISGAKIAMWI